MASTDTRTALAILLPEEMIEVQAIQAIRQEHDRAFKRWPPHLRICWPFLPLRTALSRFNQFSDPKTELRLTGFDLELEKVGLLTSEGHGDKDRVYVTLIPSSSTSQKLQILREQLLRMFPECHELPELPEFHLTIGQLPLEEAKTLVHSAEAQLQLPLTWHCDDVALLAAANSAELMKPVQRIPLQHRSDESFLPPPRSLGIHSPLPSLAWRNVLEALPLQNAAAVARAVQHQEVPGNAEWWPEMTQQFFPVDDSELSKLTINTFCSLVGAAGFAAKLSWAATKKKPSENETGDICRGVAALKDSCGVSHILSVPFGGSVRCMRHNSTRLAAVGEVSNKESGLALWNLSTMDKPRFTKLKGQIVSFDLWEELLLVLGKGGGVSLHDLADPRKQPTSLGKKDDGHALAVHWAQGNAVITYPKKVAMVDVESGTLDYLNLPDLRDPVVCPLDEQHMAVATATSCLLWDLRRSRPARVEISLPSGGFSRAIAKGSGSTSNWDLILAGSGDNPLCYVDLRMTNVAAGVVRLPTALQGRSKDLEVQCLLAGSNGNCVSAQFRDESLATWHRDTGICLGWWPSSRCLSLPSGLAPAWDGIAAADHRLYLALPGGSSAAEKPRKEGETKSEAKKHPKTGTKKEETKVEEKEAKKAEATASCTKGPGQKSQKLRTSEDVYHRVLHDANFDPKELTIGYEDRFLGPMEVQLVDFKPGGEIPFHRIYYFRRGFEVLWDRKHRLDRIFNDEASETAAATEEQIRRAQRTAEKIQQGIIKVRGRGGGRKAIAPVPPKEVAAMRFCAETETWRHCPASQPIHLSEVKVLTLNVLFELYGDVETYLQVRMVHLLEELQKSEADIILLQEVTPSFAQLLLNQAWVRERYWSSCGDVEIESVEPSGQLTLSRLPMRSVLCARLSQHKTVILSTISASLGRGTAVIVANVHLTADMPDGSGGTASRQAHRAEQLKICEDLLHDRLHPGDLGLLAGDFNDSEPSLHSDFFDAWVESQAHEEGHTFDPTENSVAARVVAAVGGRPEPRRIDRIYVAGSDPKQWQLETTLLGKEPFYEDSIGFGRQKWFLSDHYGILCRMRSLYDSSDSRGADQRILLQNPADVLAPDIINALTLKEFLPDQVELFLLGSAALGISDSGSDVDVLACSATISNAKFFEVVAKALDAQGYGSVEMAADAAVPLVRFQADDLEVEVQFSEVSSEHLVLLRESHTKAAASSSSETLHAYETLEAELFMPKEVTSQVGLAAALDVWALTRQLREGHFDRFRRLAVAVKCWARQKQLLGTSFGFPGGFAWALLASKEVLMSSNDDLNVLQTMFFQNVAAKLNKEEFPPKLWCPAGPQDRNALRSMTRGTAKILKAQLEIASREGPNASKGVAESPQFLMVEMAKVAADSKHLLQRKAIPILLEIERCAEGTVWPLTDVHCSKRGKSCLVMGLQSWSPSAGEQRTLAKSMKVSIGLDLEVRLISINNLSAEITSLIGTFKE